MIVLKNKGDFSKTTNFLKKITKLDYKSILSKYGKMGVDALAKATPIDTGLTASSWSYEIVEDDVGATIYWKNSNIVKGVSIAVILQYGHGTGTGGYVEGIDYINPALRSIFEGIADDAWKEVTGS